MNINILHLFRFLRLFLNNSKKTLTNVFLKILFISRNIYLKEEEYSNIPTDEFYAQFNTTTRWRSGLINLNYTEVCRRIKIFSWAIPHFIVFICSLPCLNTALKLKDNLVGQICSKERKTVVMIFKHDCCSERTSRFISRLFDSCVSGLAVIFTLLIPIGINFCKEMWILTAVLLYATWPEGNAACHSDALLWEWWPRQKILGGFVCGLFLGFLFWIFLKQKKTQPDTKARKKEEVVKLVRNIVFILWTVRVGR